MRRSIVCAAVLAVLLCTSSRAAAQDEHNVGILASTGSLVGLEWRVSEKIAVRPGIAFSFSDSSGESVTDSSGSAFTFDVSVPITMRRWSDLHAYVAPRFAVGHASTEARDDPGLEIDSSSLTFTLGGSFGAQYLWADRFAVFGETGLSYIHTSTEVEAQMIEAERASSSFGTRSAVGVIFYF